VDTIKVKALEFEKDMCGNLTAFRLIALVCSTSGTF
jgi:hypothetical protein